MARIHRGTIQKKDLHNPDNHNGVITHLEPDILEYKVKEEPEIKLPTSVGSSKKQASSRKTSASALLTMPKPLTVWKTLQEMRIQTT